MTSQPWLVSSSDLSWQSGCDDEAEMCDASYEAWNGPPNGCKMSWLIDPQQFDWIESYRSGKEYRWAWSRTSRPKFIAAFRWLRPGQSPRSSMLTYLEQDIEVYPSNHRWSHPGWPKFLCYIQDFNISISIRSATQPFATGWYDASPVLYGGDLNLNVSLEWHPSDHIPFISSILRSSYEALFVSDFYPKFFSLGSQPHQLWRHRVTLGIYRGRAKSTDPTKTHWWPTHPLGNHRPETSLISGLWAICSCATRSRCHFGLPAAQQQQGQGMSYQRHVETIRRGLAWWRLPKCMSAWGEIHSSVIQAVAWSPRVSALMFLCYLIYIWRIILEHQLDVIT